MSESPLWLVNTNGNVFTLSTKHKRFRQLARTYQDGVRLKRVAAYQNGAWGIGNNHRIYIFVLASDVPIRVQESTFENQRWSPIGSFSGSHLLPTDRTNWSDEHGNGFQPRESFELPSPHWKWEADWETDENLHGEVASRGGWQYATNFPGKWTPESRWNSCVRKRKWIRFRRFMATNCWAKLDEETDSRKFFIDIAVGGFDIPTQPKGHLCVWGLDNNGQVYVRQGVTHDCPEGKKWSFIPTDNQGLMNISVGPTGLMWGVTWDGQALVRLGVSRDHVYGTSWTLVTYPDPDTRLMQVSLGLSSLWALSRQGKVWYRKDIQGTQLFTKMQSATGSAWVEMVGEMSNITVTPHNQVFAVGINDKEIFFRSGVTLDNLGGKTWQILTLKENTSILHHDSYSSMMSDSLSESDLEDSNKFMNSGSVGSYGKYISKARPVSVHSEGSFVEEGQTMTLPTRIGKSSHREEGEGVVGSLDGPGTKSNTSRLEGSGDELKHVQECVMTLATPTGKSSNTERKADRETSNEEPVSGQAGNMNNGPGAISDLPERSLSHDKHELDNTQTDTTCTNLLCVQPNETNCSNIDPQRDVNSADKYSSDDVDMSTQSNGNQHSLTGDHLSVNSVITSCDNMDSIGSSQTSEANDEIIDFVTDLLPTPSPSQSFKLDNVDSNVSESCDKSNQAERPGSLPTSEKLKYCTDPVESPLSDDAFTPKSEDSVPWTTMRPSAAVSGTISMRSTPSYDQDIAMYEMTPAMPRYCWAWLSGMACVFEDPAKVSWLQDKQESDGSSRSSPSVRISLTVRDQILKKLQERNAREVNNFNYIESAVQKTSWLKKGNMKWMLPERKPQWVDCSLELEQGESEIDEGSLTIHFTFKGKQRHTQICIQDIVCVKLASDPKERTAFMIHTPETLKSLQPHLLKPASESDMEDWVSQLYTINALSWKLASPVPVGSVWSTTVRGEVFVHRPDSLHVKGHEMVWMQHGGHLKKVETSPCGVTWGIGYNNSMWTYTGGYGGGIFKATSTLSKSVNVQTDMRTVSVFENQKWYPVVGFISRGFLAEGISWNNQQGNRTDTKEEVQLPSSKWNWVSEWQVDFDLVGGVDNEGWQFSSNFDGPFHQHCGLRDNIRRRKWRRRCRLETVGPWETCTSVPLRDISVQIDPVASKSEPVVVWAVGTNGNVLTRLGVTTDYPAGDNWIHVPTDQPFRAVSVGGSNRVWAIAKDGSAWYRPGVTQYQIAGSCWLQVVPPPPAGCLLKQISVGKKAVWAVDTKGNLWHRQEITETFPEGTKWSFLANNVLSVSVGPEDQVWIVANTNFMKNRQRSGLVYRRLGINENCPTGNIWESIIGTGWEYISVRGYFEPVEEAPELPDKEPS